MYSNLFSCALPPVLEIIQQYDLANVSHAPSAQKLNELIERFHPNWQGPAFIPQDKLADETLYYEDYIREHCSVPTRDNSWHDAFNGFIWLTFPKTKQYLNQLHVQDISQFGLSPRTARRNRITHFDECGIVLAVPEDKLEQGNEVLNCLDNHEWERGLFELRQRWHTCVLPRVFGHANLEMMLNPFIGLTGKWFAVVVPKGYEKLSYAEQNQTLDHCLLNRIKFFNEFSANVKLKPLPLLGVPQWHQNQSKDFYCDKAHFRPKRESTPASFQVPLTL